MQSNNELEEMLQGDLWCTFLEYDTGKIVWGMKAQHFAFNGNWI